MKDVTDDLAPDLTQFLADQGVKPVVAATTLRKMLIVTVDLFYTGAAQSSGGEETRVEGAVGATTPKLAVATLHCKCFYKQAAQQGAFVARLIEQASKLEGVVGTVVCGDMNLDSPWPDKTSAEVQQASVGAAEFGCFPTAEGEGVTPIVNTNVTDFSTTVTKSGLQMVTPPTNFTTLKMRTKFQAQAGKIGAVAMGHKDQLVLPMDMHVTDVIVAGRDEADPSLSPTAANNTNMSLLQPSRMWPGDHFAVVAAVDIQLSKYVAKQRKSAAAAFFDAVLVAVGASKAR
mmetsp:Transcript_22417/g.57565  ORF Transcript_22417/g.57565 Transcript_22417/m.57565 type:complete len:288 (-) Transcript_22417:233-1096(-)